ncbi:MAG TPA: cobalamin-dependent protein, partial [Steroidobacteraceae bacterium]|nr:cobalamin-dependent protein [Steroidobacteraceae bacterium]
MSSPAERAELPTAESRGRLRFVTAASLFDGHDAAINIIRRILQAQGAEVVHLGHNRAVAEIVRAAIQEDADGIAVSSYQGGHNEYFRYMVDMLNARGAGHIRVVVGGGGTIAPDEIAMLEGHGVEKIYTPDDGLKLGLGGMIADVFSRVRAWRRPAYAPGALGADDHQRIAQAITVLESDDAATADALRDAAQKTLNRPPVVGVTGTGGAGKSSLTDELLNRFLRAFPDRRIAVVAMDPTRRRGGGALLGDRIRMNALDSDRVFMRSLATRRQHLATSPVLADTIQLLKFAGFDLIVVETAGIGQSDTEIVDLVDVSLYVMTSEYGAASQLEKIDMLDFADFIVLNKFEKRGAEDALRDVRKQWRRNHPAEFKRPDEAVPVYPTIASQFNDAGVNRLFAALCQRLDEQWGRLKRWQTAPLAPSGVPRRAALIPGERVRYLAEIAAGGRAEGARIEAQAAAANRVEACRAALAELGDAALPAPFERCPEAGAPDPAIERLRRAHNAALDALGSEGAQLLREWPARAKNATDAEYSYVVRGRELRGANYTESLSQQMIPKIAVPRYRSAGDLLAWLRRENLPGSYPYT